MPPATSGGLFRVELQLNTRNVVAQCKTALFQPAQHELVYRYLHNQAVEHGIQIGVLHPQLNKLPLRGVKIGGDPGSVHT